jgi:HPt (histidine-containing phosphotransfer) domain-containing protein
MTSEPDPLDMQIVDELRESVGGDQAFLAELIDEFVEDAPRQLNALRDAAAAGDAETARRAAHTLKSNARTFGASTLSSLSQQTEAAAAGGDLESVLSMVGPIEAAWTEAQAALVATRDGSS